MDPLVFRTTTDAASVLAALQSGLTEQGYSVTPDETGWAGRAEVGSKAARALAGGFSRRMVLDWRVTQAERPDVLQLVVAPASSGWSGGALGASKAKTEMQNVAQGLHHTLASQNLLVA